MIEKTYKPANKNRIPACKKLQRLMGWVIVAVGAVGLFYIGFLMEKDIVIKDTRSSIRR